jgi:hypothetical protein
MSKVEDKLTNFGTKVDFSELRKNLIVSKEAGIGFRKHFLKLNLEKTNQKGLEINKSSTIYLIE